MTQADWAAVQEHIDRLADSIDTAEAVGVGYDGVRAQLDYFRRDVEDLCKRDQIPVPREVLSIR